MNTALRSACLSTATPVVSFAWIIAGGTAPFFLDASMDFLAMNGDFLRRIEA